MTLDTVTLQHTPLFRGISGEELLPLLKCLNAFTKQYEKNELIFAVGQHTKQMGLILSGSVTMTKEDYWGNSNILAKFSTGDLFAVAYACTSNSPLSVNIIASEKTEVLFLNVRRITTVCTSACAFHTRLVRNLMQALAENALYLSQKIEHISQRSIREKLLSYLSEQSLHSGNSTFTIPYNRQELANYLSVDRSALSAELGKLKKEGILDFNRNTFTLHTTSHADADTSLS